MYLHEFFQQKLLSIYVVVSAFYSKLNYGVSMCALIPIGTRCAIQRPGKTYYIMNHKVPIHKESKSRDKSFFELTRPLVFQLFTI